MPAESKEKKPRAPGKPKKPSVPTINTDIIISIKSPHMTNIVSRTKDHEFRKYLISGTIERMWFYVSAPDQTLRYVAVISHGKAVGEIENEDGLGNADFNAGLKETAKYGYEIKELYKLHAPLPIAKLKKDYSLSPPQRYTYVPKTLFDTVAWDEQEKLF